MDALIAVVHIVVNRVQSWIVRTRVTTSGTPLRARRLRGRIVNMIAPSPAIFALKGMHQAEPVAYLMCSRLAEIEAYQRSPWY